MPKTTLYVLRTTHATYQMIRMDWGDGKPIVMLQHDVVSPPRIPYIPLR